VSNPTLMRALARHLPGAVVRTIDEHGIPADSKEAYLFALLGFLTVHGLPGVVPSCTGSRRAAILGSVTPGPAGFPRVDAAETAPARLRVVRPT
jgi:anhydro-N-acetylmuramic acid kinase